MSTPLEKLSQARERLQVALLLGKVVQSATKAEVEPYVPGEPTHTGHKRIISRFTKTARELVLSVPDLLDTEGKTARRK
ncbi:hypothetical protein K2P56_01125 [Patescibacteria group bacterium]|nr:hypothetical protein [Patescibacteria group bacterium]